MHNRDFIWKTAEGRRLKIKDMSSSHLTNTLNKVKREVKKFEAVLGVKKTKETKKVLQQEIRFRKLNRIKIDNEDELF